jgi:DNA-binding NarL/FixJ family response regulator
MPGTGTILDELSPKEQAVLELLSKGYTDDKIAETLNCKLSTIEQDLHRIYTKVEVEVTPNFEGRNKRVSAILVFLRAKGLLSEDTGMQ